MLLLLLFKASGAEALFFYHKFVNLIDITLKLCYCINTIIQLGGM